MYCVAQFAYNEIGVISTKLLETSDGLLTFSGPQSM